MIKEDDFYQLLSYYYKMPGFLKNPVGKFYNLIPESFREGKSYSFFKNEYRNYYNSPHSFEEIRNLQWRKIEVILDNAFSNIPFYQKYYKSYGVERNDIKSFEEFQKLPFLTKDQIKDNLPELISTKYHKSKLFMNSGGSTGKPLEFYLHKGITRPKENAYFHEYWSWFGYKRNDKIAQFRGRKLRNNKIVEYEPLKNALICSSYNLDMDGIREILQAMEEFQPKYLHGYPSTINEVANAIIENNIKHNLNIGAVFTSSEPLYPFMRQRIEEAFTAKCVNWYGHSERLVLAVNCEKNNYYHVLPLYGLVELVDQNNNIIKRTGDKGEIIATGFDNLVMPLIRYKTQDIAIRGGNHCSHCNRNMQILTEIEGRKIDYVFDSMSKKISVTALIYGQHLKAFGNIKKFQIHQDFPGKIKIIIVKNKGFSQEDEQKICGSIQKASMNRILVNVEYKENLDVCANGKFKFLVQNIHN